MGKKTNTVIATPAADVSATNSGSVARATANKRRKKSNTTSFDTYIYKVLKTTYPELGLTRKSMGILDALCNNVFERICTEASNIARYSKKQTITSKDIQTAVRLVFPGELGKHAVSSGINSLNKFVASNAASATTKTA